MLLDAPFNNVAAGRHRLVHTITTDLPAGEYTAGFSFVDVSGKVTRNLFWEDETLSLEISWAPGAVGLGYSQCYASMTLEHCPSETGMTIRSERVVA